MEVLKSENLSIFNFKAEADLDKVDLIIEDFRLFGNTDKKIIETIDENFKFVNTESGMTVDRDLTAEEIEDCRTQNLDIVENKIPEYELKFAEIEMRAKKQIKDAKDELNSYISQSKELAKEVRINSRAVQIKRGEVYRIAHNGFFIYLTVNNGAAIPIALKEIDNEDLQKWDNGVNQEKSTAFFNQNNEDLKEAK